MIFTKAAVKTTLSAIVTGILMCPAVHAANSSSATVNFKATVMADCFISVSPATLDFGNINASDIAGKTTGTVIPGNSKSFTITPKCYGTDKFKITYTSSGYDGADTTKQCAADADKVLMFCLNKADNSPLYMTSGTGSFTQTGGNTAFNLNTVLAKGSGTVTPGVKTASLELTIAPE